MQRIACGIVFFITVCACTGYKQQAQQENVKTYKNANGRNDSWGHKGFGGGGAMFYPAVSPFNPAIAMVACDMTGSFVTYDGGQSWRMFNLRGPASFFEFDPLDSNTVYANTIALFKSNDKGNTWQVIYPSAGEITAVISKGDHASEIVVTKDSVRRSVQALAIDPGDSKKLYAVIRVDNQTGFFHSVDGGNNWQKEKELGTTAKNIFIVPDSPGQDRTLYVATAVGVYERREGKWRMHALPAAIKKMTTYTGGYDVERKKYILYGIAGISYFNKDNGGAGIFYSEDGGLTWQNREQGLRGLQQPADHIAEWRTIATSRHSPATVYVSYNNFLSGDTICIGVAKSEDYGKSWILSWCDRTAKGYSSIAKNFSGGWLNERFGPSWGENPFSIGVSPTNPDVCYATDFGRTVKTSDGGKTWQQVYTEKTTMGWHTRGLEVTTGYQVATDPFNSNHVFICTTDIGLMESHDGGTSWNSATKHNGVPREWINSTYWLSFDPEIKDRVWAVMSANHDLPRPKMWRHTDVSTYKGGVLVSDDGGKTWRPVSKAIGEAAFTHLLVDPGSNKESRTLYACAFGKGVYKSTDAGKTWVLKNKGIEELQPFVWRIERRTRDGVLFLVVNRRSEKGEIGNEGDGALYRSDDDGENWVKMRLPEGVNAPMSLVADSTNLLLSAWGRLSAGQFDPDTGGGIFLSMDDGKSWTPVLRQDQHIHDISVDSRPKIFYACGFNGNAYRSIDRGKTWQRIRGYNFKWGKRVEPDPVHPGKIYIITFGGGIWYGAAEGDATATEDIITPVFMKK